ncbi:MAG: CPBP family intramembrane metalloprotease [Bacteroidetes bacterium]|nr:CPBP family intramembrane metalloprotease [Bacteroidota bacterium]
METNNTSTTETSELIDNFSKVVDSEPQPLTFWRGVGLALLFFGIQILVILPIAIAVMAIYGMDDKNTYNNLAMGIGLPLAFGVGAWVLYKKRGLINTAFQWKPNFLKLIPLGLLLVLGITYVVGEAMTYLPGYESILEMYQSMFEGINPIVLIIGGVIIGPVCEEIIFRGIILEGFFKKYKPNKAILFSALIFGLIHFQPLQVIPAFFIGLVLGWIYFKTQSLWVCIGIHVLNNLIALTFSDIGTESSREYFGNDVLYIVSFAAAALLCYLAYLGFRKINNGAESPGIVV